MQFGAKTIGAGVAAAVTTGICYVLLSRAEKAASFRTVAREGAFSVRDYPTLLVAETVIDGMRESAVALGLSRLGRYLFAGKRARLTVPVLADGDEDGRGWRTRLVMPARARRQPLPAPMDEVAVRELPSRRIAAVRFSGESGDDAIQAREAELRLWMEGRGLRAAGPAELAFYDPPLTPAPLRRSEVLIPLAA